MCVTKTFTILFSPINFFHFGSSLYSDQMAMKDLLVRKMTEKTHGRKKWRWRKPKNGVTSIKRPQKDRNFIVWHSIYLSLFLLQNLKYISKSKRFYYFTTVFPHHPASQPTYPPTHLKNDIWSWYITFVRYSVAKDKRLWSYFFISFFLVEKKIEKKRRRKRDLTDLNGQAKDVGAFHAQWRHVPSDGGVQLLSFTFHLSNG